jgi:hypothetical protein
MKAFRRVLTVLAALSLAGLSTCAHAGASAVITLNGKPFLNLSSTGADSNGSGTIASASLQPGESRTFSYDYSITVQEDGLVSDRQDTLCAEFDAGGAGFGGVRCSAPTGFELASAGLTLGNVNARGSNPFIGVSGFFIGELHAFGPTPTFQSQSGTVEITVTNVDTLFPHVGTFGFSDYVIVDAVPEPETYALLVGGLGLLIWRRRREFAQRETVGV